MGRLNFYFATAGYVGSFHLLALSVACWIVDANEISVLLFFADIAIAVASTGCLLDAIQEEKC